MGTNYYVSDEEPCEHCGRGGKMRHLGKSSAGWCFSVHIYPEDGIYTLDDWKVQWAGKRIEDEYGRTLSEKEMLAIITERGRDESAWEKAPYGYDSWADFHRDNHSSAGPRGLLRHRDDVPGEGPWDYVDRCFS